MFRRRLPSDLTQDEADHSFGRGGERYLHRREGRVDLARQRQRIEAGDGDVSPGHQAGLRRQRMDHHSEAVTRNGRHTDALLRFPTDDLGDDLTGILSARRGTYRVLYRISYDAHEVVVRRIEHRRDAYRPF